jgi:hypothetical protein
LFLSEIGNLKILINFRKKTFFERMGQQCSNNSTAETYELSGRKPGIKIMGNG